MAVHGLIAKKIGMTRVIDVEGQMVPVTLLKVEDQKVTKVLTPERDGYHGIQVGYYAKTDKKMTKPDLSRLRKAEIAENFSRFKEFRLGDSSEAAVGTGLDSALFADVEHVDVIGITKGRGFQGSIKRWNHKTGRRTHGSHFHRRPGSLGQRTTPGRVYKNKGMPGHMGNVQRTVQNLAVVDVDSEANVIAVKGSVPGHNNGFVIVQPSVKKPAKAEAADAKAKGKAKK